MELTSKQFVLMFSLLVLTASVGAVEDGPLHKAVGTGGKAAIEALLAGGANVNSRGAYGYTPLGTAAALGEKEIAELLLAKGADVNARTLYGQTPLHSAAYHGRLGIAELLLAKGADINARDKEGITPLHQAAARGKKDVVALLLTKNADVNAKDKNESTPLHLAAFEGNKDIFELLASMGANINAKDANGDSPQQVAANREKKDKVPSAYDIPLFAAVRKGDKVEVQTLLAKGANADAKGVDGYTPLMLADNKAIAELLLAKGATVNAKDNYGYTPLHRAAQRGRKEIVELLLIKGADINAKYIKSIGGRTPLHEALIHSHKDVVALLLAKGAAVSDKDTYGETPLETAESRKEKDLVEVLQQHQVIQAGLLEDLIKNQPRAALGQLTTRLSENPKDISTRRLIIKLSSELKPSPAIPEEARKHFVEGTAIVKAAKSPAQQTLAAQSFTEALKVAPWWGDAYYNLGIAQELAEQYNEAEQAFSFYLLSNPSAAEKREVQDRIYALSAKRKLSGAK